MSSAAFRCPHCSETFPVDMHAPPVAQVKCPHCLAELSLNQLVAGDDTTGARGGSNGAMISDISTSSGSYRYPPGFEPEPPSSPKSAPVPELPRRPEVSSGQTLSEPVKTPLRKPPRPVDLESLLPPTAGGSADGDGAQSFSQEVSAPRDPVQHPHHARLPPKAAPFPNPVEVPSPLREISLPSSESGQADRPGATYIVADSFNGASVRAQNLADRPEEKRRFYRNLVMWLVGTLILGLISLLLAHLSES